MRRQALLPFHRWLGLGLAPFLAIQALTGTLLVLHELTLPGAAASAPAPASQLVAAAEAAAPGFRVKRLFLPGSTGPTVFAELADRAGQPTYVELTPDAARTITRGPLWRFPYRAALQVHYRLAAGPPGMVAVVLVGVALATAALSGLLVWWPGRGRLRQALKVRRTLPPRLRLRQWHRTVGALVAVFALFSATTGVLLLAPDVLPAFVPAPPAAVRPVLTPQALDRAVAAAQSRFPTARLRDIRFPAADRIDLNFDAPERNARAVHTVSVRPSDATVLKAIAARTNPVLWMQVLPLHTGEALPGFGPLLLLVEAGALLFLVQAGVRSWQANRGKDGR